MERLTYVTEDGEILFHPDDLPDDEGMTITQLAEERRFDALEVIAERLANREQAEEQGLLLRLPCKVGDTVYLIKNDGKIVARVADMMFVGVLWEEFGKTVFFTREEAEAKLAEMEGI